MAERFKKLSNTISIGTQDNRIFLVNDEWSFTLPRGIEYAVDSEYEFGIPGVIDPKNNIKPMVLKGLQKDSKYLFYFALEPHSDLSGNYYSLVDCKYDNRFANEDTGAGQVIITDREDFFVDIISVPMFPFGTDLEIRVRGSEIEPYNFSAMVKWLDEDEFRKIGGAMKEIAESICLTKTTSAATKKRSSSGKGKAAKDPNCIIEGTILKKYIGKNRDIVLPEGITEIADNTFSGRDIRSIIVPEGVATIGRRVFENCFELEEADLPSSLKSLGWYGFVDCHKLRKINLPNGLAAIENSMFSECYELENVVIPETVEYIDSFAFKNCRKFTSIVIPEGVRSIGISAFAYCTNLTYLYIPASVSDIREPLMSLNGNGTPFDGCDKLTIHCPSGSVAAKYCKSHGIKYVIDSNPIKVAGADGSSKIKAKKNKKSETAPQARAEDDYGFPVAEVEDSRKRLLNRKPKKTDGPNRFDLHLKHRSSSSGISLYYFDKVWPGYASKKEELLRSADEMVKVFRDDSLESDIESELRQGFIRNGRTLHVLRSFVWTSVEYCKINKEDLADFSLEQSVDLAQFIFDRGGANYEVADKKTKRIGAGLLTKSEKDHGYDGESYVYMVQSLHALLPVMGEIYSYLLEKQDALSDVDNTLKDILAGWCAFSLACFAEFRVYAGPEDIIPEKCRKLPVDTGKLRVVDGCYYVDHNNNCVAYTGSGDTIDFPEGIENILIPSAYSHISGSREYWNHTGEIIIPKSFIPGRYTTYDWPSNVKTLIFNCFIDIISPKSSSSTYPVFLERVEFPGGGNSLNSHAFSWYPKLRHVILPENLSIIGHGAFFDTPMLKEIRIPANVRSIDGDSSTFWQRNNCFTTLIVDKGSPAEAVVRQFVVGRKELTCRVILSAAEQKRIEEENRLKRIAATLQQKLTAIYQDQLVASQFNSLKNAVAVTLATVCDKQTWAELYNRRIPALPSAYLKNTLLKVSTASSPEEAYDLLPGWIASEYIRTAEEKRKLQAFEQQIRSLTALSKESILPRFEAGSEKNEILGQIISRAKALIGDGIALSSGLAQYDGNAALETLRLTLGRKFASAGEIIDAITVKKSEEYDRLAALLEKKKTDIDAVQQEAAKLEEERSHLGFFQGKRKKEIAALLEQIPERIKQIEDDYEKAKKQV